MDSKQHLVGKDKVPCRCAYCLQKDAKRADEHIEAVCAALGIDPGSAESTVAAITRLKSQLISGFYEEEIPQFTQGEPTHELQELVTAEEVTSYVQRLVELRKALRGLHEAALPDPYDERDTSIEWLRKTINEIRKRIEP
jgi:protein-tyrosine-phosphatase